VADLDNWSELLDSFRDSDWLKSEKNLWEIAEIAMNRHNVKKSRREHTRDVVIEAFDILRGYVERENSS